jgi:toluene monooxygenase system protein E
VSGRLRTYSLLGPRNTAPSEYEIVTSRLLPYVERGFEVDVPLAAWYARYQAGSPLRCASWDSFADPRETTYTTYTQQCDARECELDQLLDAVASSPDPAWTARAGLSVSAVRFPLHGFHMIAAYIAHMAPSGRIALAALFQTADELRRIERLAQQLRFAYSDDGLDVAGRQAWQHAEAWQPLRETVERLLVTYDWGEALVGLSLCVAPMVDELVTSQWAWAAASSGDHRLAAMLRSLEADCRWHRAWSVALVRTALADTASSRAPIVEWIERWSVRARAAVRAVAPSFCHDPKAAIAAIEASYAAHLADANVTEGSA